MNAAPRAIMNGHMGLTPDGAREAIEREYAALMRQLDPTPTEMRAITEAVERWGQKDPCPIDVLADRLGEDYRAGIDSLASCVAKVGT